MFRLVVFFVLTVEFSSSLFFVSPGCYVNPFSKNFPLLIENGGSSIIYPQYGSNIVEIQTGHVVEFACPQQHVALNGSLTASIVAAICISNEMFMIQEKIYSLDQIKCSANPVSTTRVINSACGEIGQLAEVGFHLDGQRFLQTMEICFDTTSQITLYSYFELRYTTKVTDPAIRPSLRGDSRFYHFNDNTLNKLYKTTVQRETINGLLGLHLDSRKYIQADNKFYLAKGHLTARADFVYTALRDSTSIYIDVAPQWQSLNAGNWLRAETSTRNFAGSKKVSLRIWTGTYGVTALPHETKGTLTGLYLHVDSGVRKIPVPAIFWKLVYHPSSRKGVVLIATNNPYLTFCKICSDVSHWVDWIEWGKINKDNKEDFYACTVSEFRKFVNYVPNLLDSGILNTTLGEWE